MLTFQRLRRINAVIRRSRWNVSTKTGPETYTFGGFVVDFKACRVSGRSGPVSITELELKLLRYFIEHEQEAISRKTLLEEVWELPGTTSTRAVDNFIVRLRRIFEPDPSSPRHILTVRGIGYRFIADP